MPILTSGSATATARHQRIRQDRERRRDLRPSQGRETSEESAAWGHGAFTEALIEGLGEGKADLTHKGAITVFELDYYVVERVKALTGGRQHPVMSRPCTVPDFAFAVVK